MTFIVRSLFLITMFISSAHAGLIQNGSFDEGCALGEAFCLNGFDTFVDETDPNDPTRQSFARNIVDVPDGTPGVFFNVGPLEFALPSPFTGGGIQQTFDFSGGDIDINIGFNILFGGAGFSQRGRLIASLFGPTTPDTAVLSETVNFAQVPNAAAFGGSEVLGGEGNLNLTGDGLLEGLYRLEIAFSRTFIIDNSNVLLGLTGISVTSSTDGGPNELPAPGTLILFFIALAGFAATRKNKQA
jgi:hypothetical protein